MRLSIKCNFSLSTHLYIVALELTLTLLSKCLRRYPLFDLKKGRTNRRPPHLEADKIGRRRQKDVTLREVSPYKNTHYKKKH